jgi:hypothetical protein
MYEFADLGIERIPKQPRPERERHDSSSDVLMPDSLSEDEEQPPPSIDEE